MNFARDHMIANPEYLSQAWIVLVQSTMPMLAKICKICDANNMQNISTILHGTLLPFLQSSENECIFLPKKSIFLCISISISSQKNWSHVIQATSFTYIWKKTWNFDRCKIQTSVPLLFSRVWPQKVDIFTLCTHSEHHWTVGRQKILHTLKCVSAGT